MLGYDVNKNTVDMKSAQCVTQIRSAFDQVEIISGWLSDHPTVTDNGTMTDPLTQEPFGYTADEAYALRLYFETFEKIRVDNEATFNVGRKITGLN